MGLSEAAFEGFRTRDHVLPGWQEGVPDRQQWDVCPTRVLTMMGTQLSLLCELGITQARAWPRAGGNKGLHSHSDQLELSTWGRTTPKRAAQSRKNFHTSSHLPNTPDLVIIHTGG